MTPTHPTCTNPGWYRVGWPWRRRSIVEPCGECEGCRSRIDRQIDERFPGMSERMAG